MLKRILTKKQILTVSDLANAIWREHYPSIVSVAQIDYMLERFQSPQAIREQIREGFRYYLILRDSTAAGYFAFLPKSGGEIFLSKLYVSAEARGQGLARKAVAFLVRWAARNGYKKISLTVNRQNTSSLTAYKRMGFVIAGSLVREIGQGFVMDDYRMEKTVGPAARP